MGDAPGSPGGSQVYAVAAQRSSRWHGLHHFRVKAKQLRYTLELADELGSTELKTELYPLICDVQQRLGDLNDHVVAARLLSQLCHEAKTRRCASLLRKLSEKEARKATRKRKRFLRWWSDKRSG
jgi:CHAD domain-containing protein